MERFVSDIAIFVLKREVKLQLTMERCYELVGALSIGAISSDLE